MSEPQTLLPKDLLIYLEKGNRTNEHLSKIKVAPSELGMGRSELTALYSRIMNQQQAPSNQQAGLSPTGFATSFAQSFPSALGRFF